MKCSFSQRSCRFCFFQNLAANMAAASCFLRIKSYACGSSEFGLGASARRRSYAPFALICILLTLVVTILPYLSLSSSPSFCSDSNCTRNFFHQFVFWRASAFDVDQYSFSSGGREAHQVAAAAMANKGLTQVLKAAVIQEGPAKNTVIITTVNGAWAGGDQSRSNGTEINSTSSMVDVFLESFRWGDGTEALLRHLVMVALDEKAFMRCLHIHPAGHCHMLQQRKGVDFSGEKVFMSADYLTMMWRRLEFLTDVLQQGYSFIFTDADVMWLRNPFPHFLADTDVQIACDRFNGNPEDILHNVANAGFVFVRANERTVRFYRHWIDSRKSYPQHYHDQDVLNAIKSLSSFRALGLRLRLLDTQHFGGFCDIAKSDMGKVVTMHANCCKGLHAKITDLTAFVDGWKEYRNQLVKGSSTGLTPNLSHASNLMIKTPKECPKSWFPKLRLY